MEFRNRICINQSSCLDHRDFGPAIVFTQKVHWYRYGVQEDIDEDLSHEILLEEPIKPLILEIELDGVMIERVKAMASEVVI